MNYEVLVVGPLETNCYVVYYQDSLECAVVDPGADADRIFQKANNLYLQSNQQYKSHRHGPHY